MTDALDLLAALRAHLAAASMTRDRVSAFHLAQARVVFNELAGEMRSLEQVLVARESAAAVPHAAQQPLMTNDNASSNARGRNVR